MLLFTMVTFRDAPEQAFEVAARITAVTGILLRLMLLEFCIFVSTINVM